MNRFLTKMISLITAVMLMLGSIACPVLGEEIKQYDTKTGYPLLEDVKALLDEDEIVKPKDATVDYGSVFELIDKSWLGKEDETPKLQIRVCCVESANGGGFSTDIAGTYTIYYVVEPQSGHPAYEISRYVIVREPEELESAEEISDEAEPLDAPTDEPIGLTNENNETGADMPDEEPNDDENDILPSDGTEESTDTEGKEDAPQETSAEERQEAVLGVEGEDASEDLTQETIYAADPDENEIADAPVGNVSEENAESFPSDSETKDVITVSQKTETSTDEGDESVNDSTETTNTLDIPEEDSQSLVAESDDALATQEPDSSSAETASAEEGDAESVSKNIDETRDMGTDTESKNEAPTNEEPGNAESGTDDSSENETNNEAFGNEDFSVTEPGDDEHADDEAADDAPAEDDPENIVIEGNAKLKRGDKIKYPTDLGDYSTFLYQVDGKIAYCLESQAASPKDGSFAQAIFDSNKNLSKALYYGFGGAGDISGEFFPDYNSDIRYILTHMASSYFYTGDFAAATYKCTSSGIEKYRIREWIQYLSDLPDPPSPVLSLTKTELGITRDDDGTQITELTTLKGDSRNHIILEIPDGITFHNESTGEAQKGGSVQINGGAEFYFSAPSSMDGDWDSGWLTGSIDKVWKVIVITTGTKTQDLGSYASETYGGSVRFTVSWQGEAELRIIKADAANDELRLSGAVIGVYADAACSELLSEAMTGDDGTVNVSIARAYKTVYIKELSAPEGYRLKDTIYTVELGDNASVSVLVKNEAQTAGLKIYKQGEMLTDAVITDTGVTFIYRLKKLSGAEYRVTTLGNIYGSDGALLYQKGSVLVENAQTNASGEVFIEDLPLGQYLVEETKAPDGYVLSGEKHTVTLEYAGQEAAVAFDETTFTNERQKAEITAYKVDADTRQPLTGARIALYAMDDICNDTGKIIVPAGTFIESITTGSDGSARFTADLPIGYSYRIMETIAPVGYVLDSEDCLIRFSYEGQNKALIEYKCEFADCAIMASLNIHKVDAETTIAQGGATLSGAVYGLYARESITVPDGSAVAFEKDEQVTTLTTSKDGEASITGLYPGKYYLKEITPSTGYVLDSNVYEVNCQADGNAGATVDITVKEQVAKQPFQIIKAAKNAGTDAPLLKGAGFSAWLISDLNVQPDGDYDFSSASPVTLGQNGATEIFTDDRGYAITVPLPYGTYIVRETTTPDNYAPVDDFIVHITENAPSSPQVWRVLLDQEFSAKLRIVKVDVETGRTVLLPGASFTVYDLTNNQYVSQVTTYPTPAMHTTFETDASGTLMLPEALRPGRYRVTEVSAPSGYLLNPLSVDVTVGEDSVYKIDPLTNEPVIEVNLSDTAVEGRIHISKIGEMLTGYRDGRFVYENCYISGVTLEVYADETIYTPDGQKDETGERFPLILEGTLVDTLVTDASGDAWTRDLPLGKYYIIEKQAAEGFVLDDEKHYVTLSYADQETAVVVETLTLENLRQKVEVHAEKLSSNGKLHLSGATFALYTRTAIMLNGSVLVPAGTCVATATTDSTGFAAFEADLPLGEYLLNEIQAPAGYIKSDGITEIDLRYKGQDAKTASASVSMINEPVRVAISKADATTDVELDGAKLTLKDKNGRTIESWVSVAGSPHMVEGLTIGETYTLKEEIAPYGYLISNEIRFTVNGDNTVQKVVMRDDVPTGSVIINKSGEFLSDVSFWDSTKGWIGNKFEYIFGSLKDVTFDVYAYADITHADGATAPYYTAGTKIATIRTDSSGYARLDNLPLGKYYVVETGTASGYLLDDEARIIDLSYRDSNTPVVTYSESWQNERKRVHIKLNKTAESTGDALAGAAFGLYAGENISVNGKTIIQKGALIEQKATDVTGKLTFETDLPIGYEFAIREVMPPAGYVSSTDVVSFRTDDSSPDTLEVRFVDTVTRLEISKADIAGEELPGAKLTILNSKSETVESWVSGDKPHYVEMLPVGKYTLREESAPEGYMIAEEISFEVRDTGEIQKVTMVDKLAPEDHETPKTGDDHSRYLWLLPVATGWMGLALFLWYSRRKRH